MPSASRNERRKRRIRRNLTLAKRIAQQQAIGRVQALGALFTILARHGGEVEVTEEQLVNGTNLLNNGRLVIEKKDPNDPLNTLFVIRIATADEIQETAKVPAFVPEPEDLVEDAGTVHEQLAEGV